MNDFNPIIVLFLTPGLEFMIVEISNFNPIIVLFLTAAVLPTLDNFVFQSYYSLIFNAIKELNLMQT